MCIYTAHGLSDMLHDSQHDFLRDLTDPRVKKNSILFILYELNLSILFFLKIAVAFFYYYSIALKTINSSFYQFSVHHLNNKSKNRVDK
jgi:hypothetical protein